MGSSFVMAFWCGVFVINCHILRFAAAEMCYSSGNMENDTETGRWERHRSSTMYGIWRMANQKALLCLFRVD